MTNDDEIDQRVVSVDDRHERARGEFALPQIDPTAVDIEQLEQKILDEIARRRAARPVQ